MRCARCSLEDHVKILGIAHIVLLCFSVMPAFSFIKASTLFHVLRALSFKIDNNEGSGVWVPWVLGLVYIVYFVIYVLCIYGADHRRKLMLVPIMVLKSIQILAAICSGIALIYLRLQTSMLAFGVAMVCIVAKIGIDIYVIVVVKKLYNEISGGQRIVQNCNIRMETMGESIQPLSNNEPTRQEVVAPEIISTSL